MSKFVSSLYDFDWNLLNMINDKVHLEKDWTIIRVFSKDMHKYFEEWYTFEWNDLTIWMQEFKDDFRFFHSVYKALNNQEQIWYSFKSFLKNTIKAEHIWIITWRSISVESLRLFHKNIILHYLDESEQKEFSKNMRKKLIKLKENREDKLTFEIKYLWDYKDYEQEKIDNYSLFDLIDIYIWQNNYFPINNIWLLLKKWFKKEDLSNDQKKNLFFQEYFNNTIEYIKKLWLLKEEKLELQYSFSDDDEKNISIIYDNFSNLQRTIDKELNKIKNEWEFNIKKLEFEVTIFHIDSDKNELDRKYEIETKINVN